MYNDSSNATTAPFQYNTPAGAGDPRFVRYLSLDHLFQSYFSLCSWFQNYLLDRNVTFSHGSCQFPFYKRGLPRWNDIATLKPEFFLFIGKCSSTLISSLYCFSFSASVFTHFNSIGDFIYADVVRPVQPTDIEWFQVLYRHIFTLSEIKGNFIKWPSYFMYASARGIFSDF